MRLRFVPATLCGLLIATSLAGALNGAVAAEAKLFESRQLTPAGEYTCGMGTVAVLSPDGRIEREISLRAKEPTNLAFGDRTDGPSSSPNGRAGSSRRSVSTAPGARVLPAEGKVGCSVPLDSGSAGQIPCSGNANSLLREQKFPAQGTEIPCSLAQGIWPQPPEFAREFDAKIAPGGRFFRNSLLISLLQGISPADYDPPGKRHTG
jgi:hypothetical protein